MSFWVDISRLADKGCAAWAPITAIRSSKDTGWWRNLDGHLDLCLWNYQNSSWWWWSKSPGVVWVEWRDLSSKSVQSPALSLEGIDNIKCCHCLTASMLSVGDCIPDHILQEHLEDASGLLIDQARDTLDASATSQSPDCWLCDSLDVVSQHLSVSLGTSLSCKCMGFSEQSALCTILSDSSVLQGLKMIFLGSLSDEYVFIESICKVYWWSKLFPNTIRTTSTAFRNTHQVKTLYE